MNWILTKLQSMHCERVFMVRVFAIPGTPSRRTWPSAQSATSRRSITSRWPTMTVFISVRSCASVPAYSCAWRVRRVISASMEVPVLSLVLRPGEKAGKTTPCPALFFPGCPEKSPIKATLHPAYVYFPWYIRCINAFLNYTWLDSG